MATGPMDASKMTPSRVALSIPLVMTYTHRLVAALVLGIRWGRSYWLLLQIPLARWKLACKRSAHGLRVWRSLTLVRIIVLVPYGLPAFISIVDGRGIIRVPVSGFYKPLRCEEVKRVAWSIWRLFQSHFGIVRSTLHGIVIRIVKWNPSWIG
jgi:hypothetical protein